MNTWRQEEHVFLIVISPNPEKIISNPYSLSEETIRVTILLQHTSSWTAHHTGNKHSTHVYLNTWRCLLKAKKVNGKKANIPQFLFLSFSFAPPRSNVCQRVLVNILSKHSATNSLCLCSFLSPFGFSVCGPRAVYLMLTFSCKWQTQTQRDHTKPFTNSQQHN